VYKYENGCVLTEEGGIWDCGAVEWDLTYDLSKDLSRDQFCDYTELKYLTIA
jgi:hypothetical protein